MKPKMRLYIGAALILVIALIAVFSIHWPFPSTMRTKIRWAALSHRYKAEALSQAGTDNKELRHVEWDGWGMAGSETIVYLVYDPADSLAGAATSGVSGKFGGIPCKVYRVKRVEQKWYMVQFYTNEAWGQPGYACDS